MHLLLTLSLSSTWKLQNPELKFHFTATILPDGCGSDKFLCNNTRCIPKRFVCDLDDDCGDNSDEHSNCSQPTCRPNEFTCHNQRCVLTEWKCDGDNDCGDMSDEHNCCRLSTNYTKTYRGVSLRVCNLPCMRELDFYNSTWKIPYWWHTALQRPMQCLWMAVTRVKIHNGATTNQILHRFL